MLKPMVPLGGEGWGDADAEVGQRWERLGRLCLSLVLTSSTSYLESHEQVQAAKSCFTVYVAVP